MSKEPLRIDTLMADVAAGRISRREIFKRASALGLGAAFAASLVNASVKGASAQDGMTLSFDAGATGGGGGKPNSATVDYCYIVNGGNQFELNRMVDSRLVTLSADLQEYVGDLAESWEVTETQATFNLHPDAMWHDGTPVTASDIVYTLNVLTDPASGSRWGSSFINVVGYDEAQEAETPTSLSGVTAPDDHTVVIELAQPDSAILAGFYFINILPEHILGDVERELLPEQSFWTEGRIGAGPFKFIQLVEGERIEMEANPDYYLGAPQIQNLNLLFFASFETSLAAFQQGTNLASAMTANDIELVEGMEDAEIVTTPAGVGAIWINSQHEAFSDVRVRQAIAYAIDQGSITESLFQGYADPVYTEIPYVEWAQPEDANPYDYDPDTARSMLEEAGWDSSQTYTLWYYYPDQVTATVMEAMQQYLADVGINVELQFDDGSGTRAQEQEDGTWHMIYGSFGAQPDPSALSIVWGPAGEARFAYQSDEFDAEMAAARATTDSDEMATHYQNAVRILNEDAPWVWLFDRKNLIAVNSTQLTTGESPAWGPGHIMFENHAYDWTVTE